MATDCIRQVAFDFDKLVVAKFDAEYTVPTGARCCSRRSIGSWGSRRPSSDHDDPNAHLRRVSPGTYDLCRS